MINEIEDLKKEYLTIKDIRNKELDYNEYKRVVKFRVKLEKVINNIKLVIQALNEAEEYSGSISVSRAQLMKELDNLEMIKATL